MTRKEKVEMTRLWWKLMQREATSADVIRYRGLWVKSLKEKGEETSASVQAERKKDMGRPF